MLASSSATNYVLNEHEDVGQYGPCVILSEMKPILQVSCKFAWSIWNPFWLIVLMSSSESDYVPNEHEDVDKYGWFAIPSEKMPC